MKSRIRISALTRAEMEAILADGNFSAEQEMHHAHYLRGYLMRHGHFDEEKHKESEERYRKLLNRFDLA